MKRLLLFFIVVSLNADVFDKFNDANIEYFGEEYDENKHHKPKKRKKKFTKAELKKMRQQEEKLKKIRQREKLARKKENPEAILNKLDEIKDPKKIVIRNKKIDKKEGFVSKMKNFFKRRKK